MMMMMMMMMMMICYSFFLSSAEYNIWKVKQALNSIWQILVHNISKFKTKTKSKRESRNST